MLTIVIKNLKIHFNNLNLLKKYIYIICFELLAYKKRLINK